MSEHASPNPDSAPIDVDIPDPYSLPLHEINVAQPSIFQQDAQWDYFKRLREEDPVHYCADSGFGPYWSVTKFQDIVKVDTDFHSYSSAQGITIGGLGGVPTQQPEDGASEKKQQWDGFGMFIAMDPPKHDLQRATVASAVAPPNLAVLEGTIRERAATILDSLQYFTQLWNTRAAAPPQADLISMLAHGKDTKDMGPFEFLGNLLLLIVGGNDTTRNSISGGVLFLNQNPKEYDKLRGNLELIPNMVSEIIRYQTPLAHMRRTALVDTELGGKKIKAGDKLVMWYVSGNRDSDVIPNADAFLIDRTRARHHLSFGFGIHRCMGNRLAEMQLRILWEEISKRFSKVEVVAEPKRTYSTFVKGYTELMVKVHEL
ncbi:cytochrome P450 [Pseudomonadales bacterium]|nr:cytochrome P450 [Pseudomonadales bacterium]